MEDTDLTEELQKYLRLIEKELAEALPAEPDKLWRGETFGTLFESVTDTHIKPLTEPAENLLSLGGKRWRPLLLVLTAKAFLENTGKNPEEITDSLNLVPLVEFVHTASLIHDDIEDGADERRGKPCAYITYGTDTAINSGSWLYFEAPACINSSNASERTKLNLYEAYTLELRRLHLGQAMDISWHKNKSFFPTEEEYLAMVKCKTGTLASLAARIGVLSAEGPSEIADKAARTAAEIGAGFQIIDDVINLTTGNPGKKRGDDIVEGKKSLPVLLFVKKNKYNEEKINLLTECFSKSAEEGIESEYVEKAISLLEESNVIPEAAEMGINLIQKGCSDYEKLFQAGTSVKAITGLFNAMIPAAFR